MRILKGTVSTSLLTATFALALAASVAAAPQRGGGNHNGGGRSGGISHSWGGGPHGPVGGPRGHIIVGGSPRGRIIVRGGIGGGLFYDPFWGPYYPYGYGYPYPWAYDYPYRYDSGSEAGSLKTEITPKSTEVFLDGYYAGTADDFDGAFTRLHATPGGHAITLYLDGYRTVTQNIYVRPDSTVKVHETMEKLAPGEISEPVRIPAAQTGPSEGATPLPDGGSAPRQ